MAGLYSIWYPEGDESRPVYSYSIITREANKVFSWLHHRVPAILPDPESVQNWLDPNVKGLDALKILEPLGGSEITWHPVSQKVGNSRNNDDDLMIPIELDKDGKPKQNLKKSASANFMSAWLGKRDKPVKEEIKEEEPAEKKSKS